MTENRFQLKTRQICLFIIAFLPITKLFLMPSIVAESAREDMWISVAINLALDFLSVWAVTAACKRSQMTFIELLEYNFGKVVSKIILCLYVLFFMLKAVMPLHEQKEYVKFTLYTLTPMAFYFLPFFFAAFYFCLKKLRAVGRAADMIWLITLIGYLMLMLLSFTNVDFTSVLPVGARGAEKILTGAYKSYPWFGDAAYFLFFIRQFDYKKKDVFKILVSFAAHALMVTAFMIIFYSTFTSIAERQQFALTEVAKYSTVINNVGRFDYLALLLILLSNIFSISMPLYFACRALDAVCGFKKSIISSSIIVGVQCLIMLLFNEYYTSLQRFIVDYSAPFFILMANAFPVITLFLKKKENKNEEQNG